MQDSQKDDTSEHCCSALPERTETDKECVEKDGDVVFAELEWKVQVLKNMEFGTCGVSFSEPLQSLSYEKGFPLDNPTYFRLAAFSAILAFDICGTSDMISDYLSRNPSNIVVIVNSSKTLDKLIRTNNPHILTRHGLVAKAKRMMEAVVDKYDGRVLMEYFPEIKEEGTTNGTAKEKTGVASIRGSTSLLTSHRVVFENPKKYKEEIKKNQAKEKKMKKKENVAADDGKKKTNKVDEKETPEQVNERIMRVREQDVLLHKLLNSGARVGKKKTKTPKTKQ